MFNKKTYDRCDRLGKDRLAEFLEQRGLKVVLMESQEGQLYSHGDCVVDLPGERYKSLGLRSSTFTVEVELRGAENQSPWKEDLPPAHPWKFSFPSVSVEERKAKRASPLFQVSFDYNTPNATVELMQDANNEKWWEDINTKTRGEERMARIPRDLCLFLHRSNDGIWQMCPSCNSEVGGESKSQKFLIELLWPEGIS